MHLILRIFAAPPSSSRQCARCFSPPQMPMPSLPCFVHFGAHQIRKVHACGAQRARRLLAGSLARSLNDTLAHARTNAQLHDDASISGIHERRAHHSARIAPLFHPCERAGLRTAGNWRAAVRTKLVTPAGGRAPQKRTGAAVAQLRAQRPHSDDGRAGRQR